MPELPEVETVARTLRPLVKDCSITAAELLRAGSLHPLSLPLQSLVGRRIADVGRRGKLLLLSFADESRALACRDAGAKTAEPAAESSSLQPPASARHPDGPLLLAIHLRMTGRLMAYPPGTPAGAHTRCIFDLLAADGSARRLFFDDTRAFGLVLAATPDILAAWDFWRELGPEPLELDEHGFRACLEGRGAALKAALLDQKVIAGIGNIYADESLFDAGLDPRRRACGLSAAERRRLLASLQKVLRDSIAQCGSSIRDYRDANGDVGAFQNCFAVYSRGGQPCKRCGRPLQKLRVAGRATVYCPHCQK
ncbi:bifunctional DNA-formamidopyrimidine glycosylase/DNA-(apurinic or apyrimidinic site) lyase [Desulfovibrio sp. ZJ369]|uniref:bifunctional DNA-formamidopyrimidine glycosylase/DNA-(apurinic or apyrimidinic site) lyase n=1 Tax=Desulfovibrio sp. ZJ369 TaxID=2709793 RepID=UPI0013EC4B27|nr:bifunctional DNA-formamidopyrimidine glycosylase/DNA-(apurinic or apyrimidinic site) lyase [Desulfovibrio sp. ZJ369]